MWPIRPGTSLIETLLALTLLATVESWSLAAAVAAERSVARSLLLRASHHRAVRALADVERPPCDSAALNASAVEARWRVTSARVTSGNVQTHVVRLRNVRGDSIRASRGRWCGT